MIITRLEVKDQSGSHWSSVQHNFINCHLNSILNIVNSDLPRLSPELNWTELNRTESRAASLPCCWAALRSVPPHPPPPPCRQLQLGSRPRWAAVMPSSSCASSFAPSPPPQRQDSHTASVGPSSLYSHCPAQLSTSLSYISVAANKKKHTLKLSFFYGCSILPVFCSPIVGTTQTYTPLFVSGRVFWALWLFIDRRA